MLAMMIRILMFSSLAVFLGSIPLILSKKLYRWALPTVMLASVIMVPGLGLMAYDVFVNWK